MQYSHIEKLVWIKCGDYVYPIPLTVAVNAKVAHMSEVSFERLARILLSIPSRSVASDPI